MYRYLLLIGLLACCCFTATAQKSDTTVTPAVKIKTKANSAKLKADSLHQLGLDTVVNTTYTPKIKKEKVFHPDTNHSPHTAVIRSLLLPGLGQIYNHKWWKVPVIYGVLGLLADVVVFNNQNYKLFLQLSIYREHAVNVVPGDKYYAQAMTYQFESDQAIYDANDSYRRDRDLGILGFLGFWGINAVDAYIDGKFIHSYSVDNNLSMRIAPGIINLNQPLYALNSPTPSIIPGIKITFTLR